MGRPGGRASSMPAWAKYSDAISKKSNKQIDPIEYIIKTSPNIDVG